MPKLIHDYGDVGLYHIKGKGRGVIAHRDFKMGETIAKSPYVSCDPFDSDSIGRTKLGDYYFALPNKDGKEGKHSAVVMGLGSMFNTSKEPNADWDWDRANKMHITHAISPINKGEEIHVDYGWEPKEMKQSQPKQRKLIKIKAFARLSSFRGA